MPRATSISASSATISPEQRPAAWLTELGLGCFVAVDVETTGISPGDDEIIEVGAVKFENGVVVDTFQTLLDPGRKLPPFIISLTGITDRDVAGQPKFSDIRGELLEFIGNSPVVGQNISFDVNFLVASGGTDFRFPRNTLLDTAELARIFWAELPRFSLSSLCSAFAVTLHSAHRASDDAQATGEILVEMIRFLPDRVWGDLAAEIAAIAGNGHHRSEQFFDRLRSLALDIAPPQTAEAETEPDNLAELSIAELDDNGLFSHNLPHFTPREQQVQMATAVANAFANEEVLLLEAPTGTGKSLGYLVPALEWALAGDEDSNRQVVVSSHTRSLQEQLLTKEIVDIARSTQRRVPAAVLKGRDNYLCKRRLRAALRDVDGRLSDGDRHKLLPLLRWSHLTTRGDIGEIGGFRPEYEPLVWSMVCSDAAACSGAGCGANRGDYYRQALDDAKKARLLLVNHALLATDFTRFLGGEGTERRLVVDEAHQFERAIVAAYSLSFSPVAVRNVLSRLSDERSSRGLLTKLAKESRDDEVSTELVALDILVKALYRKSRLAFQHAAEGLGPQLNEDTRKRLRAATPTQEHLANAFADLISDFGELSERLDGVLRALFADDETRRDVKERMLELRSVAASLNELLDTGRMTMAATHANYVYWYEGAGNRGAGGVSLSAAPISVAAILQNALWTQTHGAVLTSATLTHEGQFAVLEKTLGIQQGDTVRVSRAVLDSPFTLSKQMRCYCPSFLPDAKQTDAHHDQVAAILARILSDVPRNTLVLCTSHASADGLIKRLTPVARKHNRVLLQQRSGRDTHEIVKAFRESSGGMLIGSSALWEGIDLVGDALQIVVVVKLPFDVPTDPWQEARGELATERGDDPFYGISVPACAIRLRQGLGRLIRHPEDRGVAILADTRLLNTRYGKVLQRALPVPLEPRADLDTLIDSLDNFFQN